MNDHNFRPAKSNLEVGCRCFPDKYRKRLWFLVLYWFCEAKNNLFLSQNLFQYFATKACTVQVLPVLLQFLRVMDRSQYKISLVSGLRWGHVMMLCPYVVQNKRVTKVTLSLQPLLSTGSVLHHRENRGREISSSTSWPHS